MSEPNQDAVERTSEPAMAAPPPSAEAPAAAQTTLKTPEFMPLQSRGGPGEAVAMERFYDVRVPVWAELGRVEMQLGDLLQLGEGSVLRLDRPVGEPVDLVSQGVKLARGEVVVVDDSFAIRIREILSTEK